jgi:hypothetical protein
MDSKHLKKYLLLIIMDELRLEYNTPQDKLLVMLLERFLDMEEKITKQNILLEQLLSLSIYKYFNIPFSSLNNNEIMSIIRYIDQRLPIISVWIFFLHDNKSCTITFETTSKWMLSTVQEILSNIHIDISMQISDRIYKSETICHYSKLVAKKDMKTGVWINII